MNIVHNSRLTRYLGLNISRDNDVAKQLGQFDTCVTLGSLSKTTFQLS